jgi:peptidyl-prolyl cis-trans isomerase D
MFDFITGNKRVVQVILVIMILPFAFFGIDFYFRDGGGVSVARLGEVEITQQEFNLALRQAQDQMREQAREDPQLLDRMNSPEFRQAVLDDLIQRRLMLSHAGRAGMTVPDRELQSIIAGVEAFRDETGRFSPQRYERLLRAQGMTPHGFETQVRQDIMLAQLQSIYGGTTFMPSTVVERLVRIREQERKVSQYVFNPMQMASDIKVTEEEAADYYEEHKSEFLLPERARLEFVVLTPEVAAHELRIDDDELRKIYDERISQYQTPEQRRASHILIAAGDTASEEERAKAKAKAEDLHRQLRQAPARFGELARQHSQDPGSAEEGGDLGYFERGFMVKPFEDAVFALKRGEISEPVQTQYGFHIIRVDSIKAVETTPFAQVREQIVEEVRRDRTQQAFSVAAQTFSDMVYEQYDSLEPVAEALNLTIQRSDWVSRLGGNMNPLLNDGKLLNAIFSPSTVQEGKNTEAIEVQPSMLMSARVVEHAPPTTIPLEQIKAEIIDHLVVVRATEKAEKEGRAALEQLRKGEKPNLKWSPPQIVTLQRRQGLHPEGVQAVFSADTSTLPTYAGVPVSDGRFVIYRITEVRSLDEVSPDQINLAARQLTQIVALEQYTALLGSLRERANVSVDVRRLAAQE